MTVWLPDVVPDEPIESAWGNTIRDRTVTPFANVAARTAGIGAPTEGMITYLADTGALEIYYGATVGWRPPWNTAWGRIGRAVTVTPQSGISAAVDLTGLAVTFTAIAGRIYRASAQVNVTCGSTTQAFVTVADGAATLLGSARVPLVGETATLTSEADVTPAGGAYTLKARGTAAGAAWNTIASATEPNTFTVDDIGPAANPA